MKTITFSDFKKKDNYMSFKNKKFEICLEPCFNGYDVAIYDLKQDLLEPKICTNIVLQHNIMDVINVRTKAQELFQGLYKKYDH